MALRQAEAGTTVEEICRKLGVSSTTFFRCKKVYGGLSVPELRELRQLGESATEGPSCRPDAGQEHAAGSPPKEMVTPAQRRELAAWGISAYQVPERRSC